MLAHGTAAPAGEVFFHPSSLAATPAKRMADPLIALVAAAVVALVHAYGLVLMNRGITETKELRKDVTKLMVHVPEQYVSKEEHARAIGGLTRWVEMVEAKVDALATQVAAIRAAAQR